MIEEIKKHKPKGATHYSFKTNQYLRGENGDFDLWLDGRWAAITVEIDFYDIAFHFNIKPL